MKSINEMPTWKQLKKELLTEQEITQLDLRVDIISNLIEAKRNKGISQKKLEEISGVSQPVIARLEKGNTIPTLETLIKLLTPLGKRLTIVDIK